MSRYNEQEKLRSKSKLLTAATQQFRTHGFNGIGLADICREGGLTHGTFYAHFASKDELMSEVIASTGEWRAQQLQRLPMSGIAKAKAIISWYLGDPHLETTSEGCLMPGMARDLRDHRDINPEVVDRYLLDFVGEFQKCGVNESKANLLTATLVGGITFARCLSSKKAKEYLKDVRTELFKLLEAV